MKRMNSDESGSNSKDDTKHVDKDMEFTESSSNIDEESKKLLFSNKFEVIPIPEDNKDVTESYEFSEKTEIKNKGENVEQLDQNNLQESKRCEVSNENTTEIN